MPTSSTKRGSKKTDALGIESLMRETQQRLKFSEAKFAVASGTSFQSINRWENGQIKSLSVALKQIQNWLYQNWLHLMSDEGAGLLAKYFSQE